MYAAIVRIIASACLVLCVAPFWGAASAEPALWVARGPTATVYLFGTVHILPKSLGWMYPALQNALSNSTELWTEADVGDLSSAVGSIRHYGLDDDGTTEHLLPEAYRERYRQQAASTGISTTLLGHARPWLAEILLGTGAAQRAGVMGLGVDLSLLAYAKAHHMSTPTFETLDSQFAMLADMPQAAQLTSLEEQIDEFDDTGKMFSALVAVWQSGDVKKLDQLTNIAMRTHSEVVWNELILRRNERFAQKIADRLQGTGTAFVAIGAAHLCGSDGVPALLRNQGFSVTRVVEQQASR